jgi:phosphatidylserine/phosphatidylglycerophosphate/cardiolipin synthase-like enzyme
MKLRSFFRFLRWGLLFLWIAVMARHISKPMPAGTDIASPSVAMSESQLEFLYDLTTRDPQNRVLVEQRIFDAIFSIIDNAQTFVVLDFFLLNDDMGNASAATRATMRPLSRELAARLIARKRANPNLQVLLITDPINDVYGGRPSPLLDEMARAGIDVVRTDISALRDSNPAYSSLWRIAMQWFGNSPGSTLPNPFREQGSVSARSWLALLNFKANHRKAIVADDAKGEWVGVVTSANPHDASSLHSNVAWKFRGELAASVLNSEVQVAHFSGWSGTIASSPKFAPLESHPLIASYVTEQAVRDTLLATIKTTVAGDEICLAMFYLSERNVVNALRDAALRGVNVRLILDPNKDAFGIEKDGVPNRPVANELVAAGNGKIAVRWYRTQGEQFHTKLILVKQSKQLTASLGSANLTRRNVGNYNLEANVQVAMPVDSTLAKQLTAYFDLLWNNDETKHIEYTTSFVAFKDESALRYWRYRFMEATGIGTF